MIGPTPEDDAHLPNRDELMEDLRQLRRRLEKSELEKADLQRKLARSRETLSFRLGHAIIQAGKSAKGALALPKTLYALSRESRKKKSTPT